MNASKDDALSESGGNIPGAQVQRIAIARALITQPKVLIMDEATNVLDNRSQERITRTIGELGITRISMAHRLATIQMADQIVVLDINAPSRIGQLARAQQPRLPWPHAGEPLRLQDFLSSWYETAPLASPDLIQALRDVMP